MQTIQIPNEAYLEYAKNEKNLDQEILQFLKYNDSQELILVEDNETTETIKIKKYDNSKTYELPYYLFYDLENDLQSPDDVCKNEETKPNLPRIFLTKQHKQNIISISVLLIWITLIIFNVLNKSSADDLTNTQNQIQIKSEFELKTEIKNKNNIKKAQQLELQKKLREQIKNLENEINISISEVKKYDKENILIDKDLINLAN